MSANGQKSMNRSALFLIFKAVMCMNTDKRQESRKKTGFESGLLSRNITNISEHGVDSAADSCKRVAAAALGARRESMTHQKKNAGGGGTQ